MTDLVYADYINSPEWVRRRIEYFAHHNRLCRMCGKGKKIHLHHLTYERMGAELDQDLMTLCERCHSAVHEFAKIHPSLSLRDATFEAIHVAATRKVAKPRRRGRSVGKINGRTVMGLDPEYARRRDARDQYKRDIASR